MAKLPAAPVRSKRPFRMIAGVSSSEDLVDGPFWNYPGGGYPNKVYCVNNITGSSTNDGADWTTPMDEVQTAVTAWEAWRAGQTATNAYNRGIIYVQGTGTSYDNLTSLPSYCDIIGIGANPRGDGAGIAVIKGVDADGAAGSARGLGLYNLQFAVSGASYYAFDAALLLRSTIENCTFMGSTAAAANFAAAFRCSGAFAGKTNRYNQFGGTNGTNAADIGMDIGNVAANNNLIENNVFFGAVHALKIHASANDNGTVIRFNLMHSHLGTTEPSTAGMQLGANSIAYFNFVAGADAITEAAAAQTLANAAYATANGAWESELTP